MNHLRQQIAPVVGPTFVLVGEHSFENRRWLAKRVSSLFFRPLSLFSVRAISALIILGPEVLESLMGMKRKHFATAELIDSKYQVFADYYETNPGR